MSENANDNTTMATNETITELQPPPSRILTRHDKVMSAKRESSGMTTRMAMEIGHASDVLKKAYDLVSEAFSLINNDEVARKYLRFDADVYWEDHIRKLITDAYDAEFNKDGKDIYHLRAFDGFGLQYPMIVTSGRTDGM